MYTYEVNRLHGTSAKTIDEAGNVVNNEQNVYSPTWVYHLLAPERMSGVSRQWVLDFSQAHGQLPIAQCPQYDDVSGQFDDWPDEPDLISALSTRAVDAWAQPIDTSDESVTSLLDERLIEVKQLLNSGYVLGVDMWWEIRQKKASNGEQCIYEVFSVPEKGHAVTIVGYDDTIWCDINGNGEEDSMERGAFKIANSWGADVENHNQGYIWISYDALNLHTAVSNDREDEEQGCRAAAFAFGATTLDASGNISNTNGKNRFIYMQVQDYNIDYAAIATFEVSLPSHWATILQRTGADTSEQQGICYGGHRDSMEYTCKLAFDYSAMADPISDYLTGYTWEMWTMLPQYAYITDCDMVDNLGNVIKNYTYSESSAKWECSLNLAMGDLDYDGILTMFDALLLYDYVGYGYPLSNVQMALGDMNDDGVTDNADVMLLYQQFGGARRAGGIGSYADFIAQLEAMRTQSNA